MASIKMCDFCGKVTNQMAAEVMIRPVANAEVFNDNPYRGPREAQMDAYVKDACHSCVGKFFEVRELKILEANDQL